ncbi:MULTISPECIES: ATP-binding protein [unclassified Streptomyces]|uniref:ATP-binding protein n=1 Tax=unclassified Streptomyces TaxID=2593676 RepID=UPI002DD7BF1C|nr:ATP-binding protein [Streptomyces sp. NBC_01445]WSE06928.1 ATP-binding protein [Streptomyces sp. NBC_01445]
MNDDEPTFTIRLSATPRGARLARRLTVQQLIDWTCPFETAERLVAELANNAITHGRVPGRDFRLTLKLTPRNTLRIEVTDTRGDSTPLPLPHHPPLDAESGRGLVLIEALADHWGTTLGPMPTKSVWAELDVSK